MNEKEFHDLLGTLDELSGNDLKDRLAQLDEAHVVSLLNGEEFDDIGLGKKSVQTVAEDVFGEFEAKPTVTQALRARTIPDAESNGHSIEQLYLDMEMLDSKSGNDQKDFLREMLEDYAYPDVVSYAVLNDWSLGFGNSTLASALGVKESLPFYEYTSAALRDEEPLTEPEVGSAFSPMLAVPESRGRPDNPVAQKKVDGYRILIHFDNGEVTAFSRRMNDVTESLPELEELSLDDGRFIIDAEVIAENGSYSDTSSRVGRDAENVERDVEMNFKLFDVIHADFPFDVEYDTDRTWEQPYHIRYKILQAIHIAISDDRTEVLDYTEDIEAALDEAAELGHEGIIVKDLESTYEFGKRSSSWQKVKLDDETVDVKVTGFVEGEGRMSGTLGKVRIETGDGVHVGYSGSGFSDEQRDEIWENQDDWMDRTIEVEARGLGTQDKLRMPIFKRDRQDDGEPDSFDRVQEVMKDI